MGDYENALTYANEIIKKCRQFNNRIIEVKCLTAKAYPLWRLGKLDETLEVVKKGETILNSLTVEDRLSLKIDEATLFNIKGVVYFLQGRYDSALEYYNKSLEIREELQNGYDIAISFDNLGVVYREKGELDTALEYHNKSLQLRKTIGEKHHIANTLNNIGVVYYNKGELDLALDYFQKCVKVGEESKITQRIAGPLYRIILTYLDKKDDFSREKAQTYADKLEHLSKESSNKYSDLLSRLAQSMILKSSKRTMHKIDAQRLLQTIISEDIIDHRLTLFAMINLCELLLEELKLYGEKEVMEEVQNLSEKISHIAHKQRAFSKLAESYVIQSKIALLNLDTIKAKELLAQAQFIADEKGFKQLAAKISFEFDELLDKLDQWNDYISKNTSFAERIEFIEFEKLIDDVIHQKFKQDSNSISEEPVLLLIIDEAGSPRFTKKFTTDFPMQESLIGSFLSAINLFSKEAFSSNLPIERIKHQDFSIVMKQEKPLLFCYVFKGQSYSATQNITIITGSVKSKLPGIWDQLSNPFVAVVPDNNPDMNLLIDEIIYAASSA
ncbi:MAG: tetratricopeptide repeat protein [Candidatus Kariarchaeaceae archaeon]